MGGGLVLEDVYAPYHWPFSQFSGFHNPPLYAVPSAPLRYYDFDVESPLVQLIAAHLYWPYVITMNGNHHEEGRNDAIGEGIRNVINAKDTSTPRTETVTSIQEPVISQDSVALAKNESSSSQERMTSSSIEAEGFSPELEITSPSLHRDLQAQSIGSDSKSNEGVFDGEPRESRQPGEMEKSVQSDEVGSVQSEEMEESVQSEEVDNESGSDEERRAATTVQARYRGHLVRMSRPIVQLRAIARIEETLKKLKGQAGDGAFQEELRRTQSMAKLAFEEGTMKLLLQLDNIQGSHPLVRQIRKSVAREIISLQESVDALLSQSIDSSR